MVLTFGDIYCFFHLQSSTVLEVIMGFVIVLFIKVVCHFSCVVLVPQLCLKASASQSGDRGSNRALPKRKWYLLPSCLVLDIMGVEYRS